MHSINRLRDVNRKPGRQCSYDVVARRMGRDRNRRGRIEAVSRRRTDPANQREAVFVGHADVGDQQVRSKCAQQRPRDCHDGSVGRGTVAGTTQASTTKPGTGERDAAISLVAGLPPRRVTVGRDKGYGTRGFIETLRHLEATPHVAIKKKSRTLDRRMTRHAGYAISQRAQAHRRSLRLDEDRRRAPQAPSSWRRPRELAVSFRRGIQPGPHAHVGDRCMTRAHRPSQRQSIDHTSRPLN